MRIVGDVCQAFVHPSYFRLAPPLPQTNRPTIAGHPWNLYPYIPRAYRGGPRAGARGSWAIVTSKPNHFFGYRHVKLFDRPRIARRDDTPPFSRIIGSTIVFDGSADWRGGGRVWQCGMAWSITRQIN